MVRVIGVVALCLASTCALAQPADRIWSGGTILTMNDAAMRAEAIAERDGRIVAVGRRADVMKLRGEGTELIDLNGRALLPGFVDAHGHMVMGGLQALSANLLAPPDGDVVDIASLQQTLRDWVAANQEAVSKVKLIVGFGYDNAQLKELRHPTRDDLDAVSSEYPIFIIHQSGHLAVLNSKALEVAGISAASKNPEGGVIQRRDGSQEPNGVLEELAMFSALFVLSLLAFLRKMDVVKAVRGVIGVSFLGIVFAGTYTVQDIMGWMTHGKPEYSLYLPTCTYGLVFYFLVLGFGIAWCRTYRAKRKRTEEGAPPPPAPPV